MSLKFIALSGTTDVTENFYLYEYANDIIIVDAVSDFPKQKCTESIWLFPTFPTS